jgi:phosphatidylethanolamine/phosphatidyl-N-methylethanolamine N-methyltransferase
VSAMESVEQVGRAYRAFAPAYDAFFGAVLEPGRRAAIRGMDLRRGARVLEVGVGTGLSLAAYPRDVSVFGVDLAPEMLDRARRRVARKRLSQILELKVMDARALDYPDAHFDVVVAMYVVSVTPDPERMVSEMLRVCRPGGQLVIVNHFRTESSLVRGVEKLLRPLHRLVNFRADLDREQFLRRTGLQVQRSAQANILGYSTVMYCTPDDGKNDPRSLQGAAQAVVAECG